MDVIEDKHLIYLSGPMTGYPEYNFPAFRAAEERWRDAGWEVLNPIYNFNGDTSLTREEYMRLDIVHVCQASAIAMLKGWPASQGANVELIVARAVGNAIYDDETMQPLQPETFLGEATRIIHGPRQKTYGHPREDFARTADIWTGQLRRKLRDGVRIEPVDIPLLMIGLKLSRLANGHHRDSFVDIAGYVGTADLLTAKE